MKRVFVGLIRAKKRVRVGRISVRQVKEDKTGD
jgi:hypothetical protein